MRIVLRRQVDGRSCPGERLFALLRILWQLRSALVPEPHLRRAGHAQRIFRVRGARDDPFQAQAAAAAEQDGRRPGRDVRLPGGEHQVWPLLQQLLLYVANCVVVERG